MDGVVGMPAIEVAIGLMFLFFLLSVIVSQVNETVSSWLNFRAKELQGGIRSLLGSLAEDVMSDEFVEAETRAGTPGRIGRLASRMPVVSGLRQRVRDNRAVLVPSYLRSRTFALALVDVLASRPADPSDDAPPDDRPAPVAPTRLAGLTDTIEHLAPGHPARGPLLRLLSEAGDDLDAFMLSVEDWYDDAMERVSGWYRRNAQKWLLVYAGLLTVLLNVDTIVVAQRLWRDDALRAAVVAEASEAVADEGSADDPGACDDDPEPPGGETPCPDWEGSEPAPADDAPNRYDEVTEEIVAARSLGLPLGWTTDEEDPRAWPGSGAGLLSRLLGWSLTVVALSLGAPFWFDLLGKVSRLRQTGVRPADDPSPGGRARPGRGGGRSPEKGAGPP